MSSYLYSVLAPVRGNFYSVFAFVYFGDRGASHTLYPITGVTLSRMVSLPPTVASAVLPLLIFVFSDQMLGHASPPFLVVSHHVFLAALVGASIPVYNFTSCGVLSPPPGSTGILDASQRLVSFVPIFGLPSRGIPTPPSPG